MYRRYAIVKEEDLADGVAKLAAADPRRDFSDTGRMAENGDIGHEAADTGTLSPPMAL